MGLVHVLTQKHVHEVNGEGFPEDKPNHTASERVAVAYLAQNDELKQTMIRFDIVSMLALGNDRNNGRVDAFEGFPQGSVLTHDYKSRGYRSPQESLGSSRYAFLSHILDSREVELAFLYEKVDSLVYLRCQLDSRGDGSCRVPGFQRLPEQVLGLD